MSKSVTFPLPIVGVDMLSDETALTKGAVRYAMNVDIGRAGRTSRRDGSTLRLSSTGLHSLYHAAQKGWTVVARDSQLYKLDVATYSLTPLMALRSAAPLSYTEYNGNLYFSSVDTIGWVPSNSTQARPLGVPVPSIPTLTATKNGTLLPGKYGLVVTWVDDRGEEGGACDLQLIDLPEGGGIRMDNLAVNPGWLYFIYLTSANGDILRLAAEIPALFTSYLLGSSVEGGECDTLRCVPLPSGELVCWHNGRLMTAKNGAIYFSEPQRPHVHNPAHNVIPMSGHIAFMESVGTGMYVGDSRGVWYLAGTDPSKFEMSRCSPCRAVSRSSIMAPPEHFPEKMVQTDKPVAIWLSTSGYVVGMAGGATVELQPDRIKVPAGLRGRSVFLLREGRKQVITPVNSTSTTAYGVAIDSVIP